MAERIRFHFDPLCPWCYQTSRWARRLSELGEVDIDWAVFSLELVNADNEETRAKGHARAGNALRTVIAVRDAAGAAGVGAFYAAVGRRHHEQREPIEADATIRAALADAGLDTGLLDAALADESTSAAVEEEHRRLVERTRSFGVPTIVLDGGDGPAIFGPVISVVPSDEDAVELWRHVVWLTRYDNFSELKRDRTVVPDLPAFG
ncbi:Rv2466c family mycothiol-dependent reductase [soil metagenome]